MLHQTIWNPAITAWFFILLERNAEVSWCDCTLDEEIYSLQVNSAFLTCQFVDKQSDSEKVVSNCLLSRFHKQGA